MYKTHSQWMLFMKICVALCKWCVSLYILLHVSYTHNTRFSVCFFFYSKFLLSFSRLCFSISFLTFDFREFGGWVRARKAHKNRWNEKLVKCQRDERARERRLRSVCSDVYIESSFENSRFDSTPQWQRLPGVCFFCVSFLFFFFFFLFFHSYCVLSVLLALLFAICFKRVDMLMVHKRSHLHAYELCGWICSRFVVQIRIQVVCVHTPYT